jgi:hypothetical protein
MMDPTRGDNSNSIDADMADNIDSMRIALACGGDDDDDDDDDGLESWRCLVSVGNGANMTIESDDAIRKDVRWSALMMMRDFVVLS